MDNIPMRPPKLPGYDFVQMLGSGATATVYLYNQRMPARPVAVKASAKTLDPRAAALFNREANFMAKLSSHPYILPVYGAGVTSDGHGYIVIEDAPGGTYNSIMKARSMTCEQVLDLGIKLSSALFTAHRSNIIHHQTSSPATFSSPRRACLFWVISVSPPMCMTAPKPDSRRRGHRLRCFSI